MPLGYSSLVDAIIVYHDLLPAAEGAQVRPAIGAVAAIIPEVLGPGGDDAATHTIETAAAAADEAAAGRLFPGPDENTPKPDPDQTTTRTQTMLPAMTSESSADSRDANRTALTNGIGHAPWAPSRGPMRGTISDVEISSLEKSHPEACAGRIGARTIVSHTAMTPDSVPGVINDCTKCIQYGPICASVRHVTATLSNLIFPRLFLLLSSWGELRYCLYFKNRFFYNLYKVLNVGVVQL